MLYLHKKITIDNNNKNYHKVRDHCHYTGKYSGAAHDIYSHMIELYIIKELAEEFEGELECLRENTEKYITFPVPIKKEIKKRDENGNDKIMKISCKIKFSDSFRFISTSLSSIVDVLSDGLHGYKRTDCRSFLNYMIPKDD